MYLIPDGLDCGNHLRLALELEHRACAQLLLDAGATRAKALAHRGEFEDTENLFFVGHQNRDEQMRAKMPARRHLIDSEDDVNQARRSGYSPKLLGEGRVGA